MMVKNILLKTLVFVLAFFASAFNNPAIEKQTELGISPDKADKPFAAFLSFFDRVEVPYGIGLDDLPQYTALKKEKPKKAEKRIKNIQLKYNRAFIPELTTGAYSRMGPPLVEPVARFYPSNATIAVIYMTYYPFRFSEGLNFKLCVFDLYGNQISYQKVNDHPYYSAFPIGEISAYETRTFSIGENGFIWVNRYENIWKEDVDQKGFDNNEIVDHKLVATDVFQINPNGLIEQLKEYPLADRVSLD